MPNRPRSLPSVVLVTLLGVAMSGGGPASAIAATPPPNQSFVGVAHGPELTNTVVAVGPFSGVGTNVAVDSTSNPDGTFTDTDRFEFPRGDVIFRITYTERVSTNPLTCVTTIVDQGSYTLVGGTRAFAGIAGEGDFMVNGTSVGARNGLRCAGPAAPPVAVVLLLRGTGTTRLPHGA